MMAGRFLWHLVLVIRAFRLGLIFFIFFFSFATLATKDTQEGKTSLPH